MVAEKSQTEKAVQLLLLQMGFRKVKGKTRVFAKLLAEVLVIVEIQRFRFDKSEHFLNFWFNYSHDMNSLDNLDIAEAEKLPGCLGRIESLNPAAKKKYLDALNDACELSEDDRKCLLTSLVAEQFGDLMNAMSTVDGARLAYAQGRLSECLVSELLKEPLAIGSAS